MFPETALKAQQSRGRPLLLRRGRALVSKQQRGSFRVTLIRTISGGAFLVMLWIATQTERNTTSLVIGTADARNAGTISSIDGYHNTFSTISVPRGQSTTPSDPKILLPLTSVEQNQTMSKETTQTKLRYDWSNMPLTSELAKRMLQHQRNCELPLGNFYWRNRFGLGSDLHSWSQALCNAMDEEIRLRSAFPWIWLDQHACDATQANQSSMLCYFPESELLCPDDEIQAAMTVNYNVSNPIRVKCSKSMQQYNKSDFRAASSEFLFRRVSQTVIDEAERQLHLVFPDGVPDKLITVHMRWGDKKREMKLKSVNDYVQGVHRVLDRRGEPNHERAHIFLSTEDPKAVTAFRNAVPKGWKVFVDQYYHDMLPLRDEEDLYNQGPKTSKQTKGHAGLVALGSLLVAMEADYYVLTTASNWSRLMNELRKNVLDPRCNGCTLMEDLHFGEW